MTPENELGDKRACRIAYSDGILEIRMPLPQHEVNKELVGGNIKMPIPALSVPSLL